MSPQATREKLKVLLVREGVILSAKCIDRIIGRLKARGVLREPLRGRRKAKKGRERLWRPRELVVKGPGDLVQIDSKQVDVGRGKVYEFGAVDYFTRKRVVGVAARLTSAHGGAFLRRVVEGFPSAQLSTGERACGAGLPQR